MYLIGRKEVHEVDEIRRGINRLFTTKKSFGRQVLAESDLSSPELTVLRAAVFHKGLTQTEICEHAGDMDKAAVTRLVQRLEDKGYITRVQSPQDARAKLVYPSEKALEASDRLTKAENAFYEWLFSELSSEEIAHFSAVISKLGKKAVDEQKSGFKNTLSEDKK